MSKLVVALLQQAQQDKVYKDWLQKATPDELGALGLKPGQQAVLLSNLLLTHPFAQEDLPDWEERYGQAFAWVDHRAAKIPWTPLRQPLRRAKIALITTAGLYCCQDKPFLTEDEERGDPTYRIIPDATLHEALCVKHHLALVQPGVDGDTNHLLPLHVAHQMKDEGIIGALASHHYSFMGYIPRPGPLVEQTAPLVAQQLHAEEVDAVILFPV